MTSDEELMRVARKRAENKVGFYIHFSIYLAINALLVLIWWFTGDGFPWSLFPLGFWGVGIVAHFVGVFVGTGVSDRMAQREYERLRQGKIVQRLTWDLFVCHASSHVLPMLQAAIMYVLWPRERLSSPPLPGC